MAGTGGIPGIAEPEALGAKSRAGTISKGLCPLERPHGKSCPASAEPAAGKGNWVPSKWLRNLEPAPAALFPPESVVLDKLPGCIVPLGLREPPLLSAHVHIH